VRELYVGSRAADRASIIIISTSHTTRPAHLHPPPNAPSHLKEASKMGDPQFAKYPDLQLSQHIFQLTNPAASKQAKQSALKSVQDAITENKMAPLYRYLAHPVEGVLNAQGEGSSDQPTKNRRPSASLATMLATRNPSLEVPLSWDEKLYESLKAESEKELEAIQKEEEEAEEKAGETEVQAARGKRAELYNRIGDKV
jgi:26S proteasome regulatory subunit N7